MGLYNTQRAPFSTRNALQQRSVQASSTNPLNPMSGGSTYGPAPAMAQANNGPGFAAPQGRGMMASNRNTNPNNMADAGGVVAGQAGPQMQVPQGPAFDPNDPQNAALAGYMAR